MNITATINNSGDQNTITVSTNGSEQTVTIPAKANHQGSAVNGGELLLLALATCYCNDVYREAAKKNIQVTAVTVRVVGEFGAAGEPAKTITYHVNIVANASQEIIDALILEVDALAEIHNTLRQGIKVQLSRGEE